MPEKDSQSRKWQLTINNPHAIGLTAEQVIAAAKLFNPDYFCMADEIGASGTYHTHIYLYSHSPMRFSTVKNRFPTAHIEHVRGTSKENRDYIRKEGKWADSDKSETSVEGTFYEFGSVPSDAEEKCPKMAKLIQDVTDGFSTREIVLNNPNFAFKLREIDDLREKINLDHFRFNNRDLTVNYLYGDSGTGKTRSIYEKHPAKDICRITDYGGRNGIRFDAYHGQPVLVFEEFHSQIPIAAMLNFLDIYPLMLPARYNDRVACYTIVYITSNIPFEQQYEDVQRKELETWNALCRRVHNITEFRRGGIIREVRHEK